MNHIYVLLSQHIYIVKFKGTLMEMVGVNFFNCLTVFQDFSQQVVQHLKCQTYWEAYIKKCIGRKVLKPITNLFLFSQFGKLIFASLVQEQYIYSIVQQHATQM